MLPVVSIVLIIAGATLLLHHGWKHSRDDPATSHAQRESCAAVCYFQLKDILHFETWVLACFANAAAVAFYSPSDAQILCAVGLFLIMALAITRLCASEKGDPLLPIKSVPRIRLMLRNVSNHETWILICFTSATSLAAEAQWKGS